MFAHEDGCEWETSVILLTTTTKDGCKDPQRRKEREVGRKMGVSLLS